MNKLLILLVGLMVITSVSASTTTTTHVDFISSSSSKSSSSQSSSSSSSIISMGSTSSSYYSSISSSSSSSSTAPSSSTSSSSSLISSSSSSTSSSSSSPSSSSSSSSMSSSVFSMGSTSSSILSSSMSSSSSAISSSYESSSMSSSSSSSSNPSTTLYYGQTYSNDCSEYAYLMEITLSAGTNVYKVNLSGIGLPYVRPNLENVVFVRGGSTYNLTSVYRSVGSNTYTALITATGCPSGCGSNDDTLYVGIYGHQKQMSYGTSTASPSITYNPVLSDFTSNTNVYTVNLLNEIGASAFNVGGTNKMLMTVFCDDYSSYSIDLKSNNLTTLLLSNRQWAVLSVSVDDGLNESRYRILPSGQHDVNYYLIASPYAKMSDTFILLDTTGQFYPPSSFFYVSKAIGSETATIFSNTLDADSKEVDVHLVPNEIYDIYIISAYGYRYDFGKITASQNKTVYLTAVSPKLGTLIGMYDGLTAYLTQRATGSPDIMEVGFFYNSSNTINATFSVWNITSGNDTPIYTGTSTSDTGQFIHNINIHDRSVFQVKGDLWDSNFGEVSEVKTISLYNESFNASGFNLGLGGGVIMGFTGTTIMSLFVFFTVLLITVISTKQTSYTTGSIIGLLTLGFFRMVGWVDIPYSIISILLAISIAFKLMENRVEVAG